MPGWPHSTRPTSSSGCSRRSAATRAVCVLKSAHCTDTPRPLGAMAPGVQQRGGQGSSSIVAVECRAVGGAALLCCNSDNQRWLPVAAACSLAGAPDHSRKPHLQQRGRLLQQHGGITIKPPGPSLL
jgi:hypothetical protein